MKIFSFTFYEKYLTSYKTRPVLIIFESKKIKIGCNSLKKDENLTTMKEKIVHGRAETGK